jgi:hypothetical protein
MEICIAELGVLRGGVRIPDALVATSTSGVAAELWALKHSFYDDNALSFVVGLKTGLAIARSFVYFDVSIVLQ